MTMRTLSPEESAELAGVSKDTIEKYMAIGLLSSVEDSEEGPRFSESDIRALFYTKKSFLDSHDEELPPRSEELATLLQEAAQNDEEPSIGEKPRAAEPEQEVATEASQVAAPDQDAGIAAALGDQTATSSDTNPSQQPSSSQPETESGTLSQPQMTAKTEGPSLHDQIELTRALREQIEVLKEERDWLRQRVEHLEVRGEREQMLLLSESETVRRLVTQRSLTDRFLQTLRLPWISSDGKK